MSAVRADGRRSPIPTRREVAVKRCPVCASSDIQRSHFHHSEAESHRFHSPYRCQRCGRRFWALSRKARIAIGVLAAGTCVLAAIVLIVGATLTRSGSQASVTAGTPSSGAAMPAPAAGSGAEGP